MNLYHIEPIDPLIFRDGRPFRAVPGDIAQSMFPPPPSAIAGAARSSIWTTDPRPTRADHHEWAAELRGKPVHGPLLYDAAQAHLVVPKPADALAVEREHPDASDRVLAMRPLELGTSRVALETWNPVGSPELTLSKPLKTAPLWRWPLFESWLTDHTHARPLDAEGTLPAPPTDRRVHVSIDSTSQTAAEGRLFGTEARTWAYPGNPDAGTSSATLVKLGMLVRTPIEVPEGPAPLGGERRLARWSAASTGDTPGLPGIPDAVVQSARGGAVRVILLTPAWFRAGSVPSTPPFGTPEGSRVIGAVHERPLVLSGWDLARREPKPTRRFVPAGAVFFIALGGTPDEREAWLRSAWLHPVSDPSDEHDPTWRPNDDGFGLAAMGVWDGTLSPLTHQPTERA